MSDEFKKTIAMPWTPEEFLKLRRDEAGSEPDPTPLAAGHAWVRGVLVDVGRLATENEDLRATLARVEALARKYDDEEHPYFGDKIRAALAGEP